MLYLSTREKFALRTISKMESKIKKLEEVKEAAKALIEDVRERYPNENLRCPHMIRLDQALSRAEEGGE